MTSIQVNYGDVEPAAKVVEYGLPTLYHADNENVLTGNHSTTSGSLHEIGLPTKPSSDTGKLLSDNNGLPTKRASDDTIYDTREVINHAETSYSKLSNNSMIISAVLLLIAAIAIVIAVVFTTDNSFSIKLNEETNTDAQKGKSCEDGACKNGARCIPANATQKDITCLCSPGFSGVYCDQDVDECASSPCSANAMCKDGSNGYTCVCLPGYTGQSCQTEIDECVNDPCKNQGTCEDKLNRYNCICANGYTGMDCSTDIDECSSAPCQNDGTCLDLVSMYSCKCPNGFNGSDCEIGINECESSPCMNDATCKDGILHYNCICMTGYTGTHCETEIDECLPDPCQYNGTCNDYIGFYNCTCPKGYEGQNCQIDIDECSSAPCQNDGTCLDLVSMYSCKCPNGFNGSDCEIDINECESSPCMNDATCKDGILHYNCICMTGYTGTHCETEIDECLPDPCQYNGTCNDYIGFYNCTCPKGYGGQNCQIEGPCLKSPCKNGGRCVETEDWRNYYCQCPHCTCDTTIGVLPDCELDLLFCFKNNISSTKLKHPYECDKYVECTDMFYLYENQCATSLTLDNNGNCVSKAAMASCNMTVIDVSKSKVTANQTCADYECFNGGTCVDPPGKPPTCTCPIDCACGDMGDHCQWKDEFSCLGRLDGTYTNIRNCSTIIHCQNQRADLTADPCPAGTAYDSENKVCQLIEKLPCATKP